MLCHDFGMDRLALAHPISKACFRPRALAHGASFRAVVKIDLRDKRLRP